MQYLDIKEKLPLQGVSLVEASAGTGKTFSIAKIILQVLLSDNINIEEILVVTFTDAATKELRSKIRVELHKFEKYLTQEKNPDSTYDAIIKNSNKDNEEQITLIRTALLNIDQAAIYTIHSFCQRMLTENAFESKIAFGAELLTDTSELIREIGENFWRKNFVNITEEEKELYADIKFETIIDLTETFIKYHKVELVNSSEYPEAELKEKIKEIYDDIASQLNTIDAVTLENKLLEFFKEHAPNLNQPFGVRYYEKTIKNFLEGIKDSIVLSKDLQQFSSSFIVTKINANAKKKDFILPDAEFFKTLKPLIEAYESLEELQKSVLPSLYKKLFEYTRSEFEHTKELRHILTFNDLINKLYDVLNEESKLASKPLTELIRNKYKIAFVDEFQDTDKQQYSIFKHIFEQSDKHGFFMIGDPKQSIYKFRGADIFSYLKAKNDAHNKYTLLKNFRSEQGIIDAVNAVFQFRKNLIEQKISSATDENSQEELRATDPGQDNVFVCSAEDGKEGIDFNPAEFGKLPEKTVLTIDKSPQNLQLWLVDGFNPAFIEHNIAKNIALEITKLLPGKGKIEPFFESEADGKRSLTLGDIAILVNTNKQAAKIKNELSRSNIPAVIQRTAKIFESRQAAEIKLWLKAIIKPTERNIRPLFVTDILRKSVNEIETCTDSEVLRITEELTLLNQRCRDEGVFSSFIHFIKIFEVMEKALKDTNGERIITNYFHIADLLHKHELKSGRNIEKTLSYLEQEMQSESSDDEKQEQLESDKNSVRIMTIHKSKGLQFPVVFCPYIWSNSITKGENKQKVLLFNEYENGEFIQKLDLGADKEVFEKHQKDARIETLAEHVRLLYVALTRAGNRCYMAIGNDQALGKSVLSYIFTDDPKEFVYGLKGDGVGVRLKEQQNSCIENLTKEFLQPEGKFTNIINVERKEGIYTQPCLNDSAGDRKISLSAKELKSSLFQKWSVGSFSGLIVNIPYNSDTAKNGAGAFGLPKGKIFGTAVHKIFENYYKRGAEIFSDPVLRKHYFESPLEYEPFFRIADNKEAATRFNTAETMFKTVLSAKIATGNSEFILEEIAAKDAKPEFTFYHRINKISPKLLKELFAKFATGKIQDFSEKLEGLGFSMKKGYMHGEIDLLFRKDNQYFVLDWKTNHLGADFANYAPGKIEENMCRHLYMLQAHIYSLATHLFLKQQLKNYDYDTNFGGFIYLYTRGVDNDGNGFFAHKPPPALIDNMEKELI